MDNVQHKNIFGKLKFIWGTATDKGKVREENEDSFHVEPEIGLFIVSDGMGGHLGGSLASKIVTDDLPVIIETGLDKLRSTSQRSVRRLFKKAVGEQSKQLWLEGCSESGYKDMGATLVMVMFFEERIYIANLGDSRIDRFRNNKLLQMSKDHSVVSELIRNGIIDSSEAETHGTQGQITKYIGMETPERPFVRTFILKKSDRFLLCTDGLTDLVSDNEIAEVLTIYTDPNRVCKTLVEKANNLGGHDNITTVIVDWVGS